MVAYKDYAKLEAQNKALLEALKPLAAFAPGIGKMAGMAWARPNMPDGVLHGVDFGKGMLTITQADILKAAELLTAAGITLEKMEMKNEYHEMMLGTDPQEADIFIDKK